MSYPSTRTAAERTRIFSVSEREGVRTHNPEARHILYLRILYPIHIQAPKKDIISYPYPGPKKGYGYISYM
jgi:hypothetical protein